MILPGLCSVTFRQLSPREIINLAADSGLRAIEWGGDIHVPPGDIKTAEEVREMTVAAGLQVSSYGSYYRATDAAVSFSEILQTAVALGAKVIRVWAGSQGSADASPEHFQAVADDLKKCVSLAGQENISIALEFHDGTLTDTNETALRLLEMVPGASIIWQPKTRFDLAYRLAGLEKMLPRLGNLHVFQWAEDFARLPLQDGAAEWKKYFALANSLPGDRFALLEFVAGDTPEALRADAASLVELLS